MSCYLHEKRRGTEVSWQNRKVPFHSSLVYSSSFLTHAATRGVHSLDTVSQSPFFTAVLTLVLLTPRPASSPSSISIFSAHARFPPTSSSSPFCSFSIVARCSAAVPHSPRSSLPCVLSVRIVTRRPCFPKKESRADSGGW